ncbi:MAG: CRISPR-associated endonuclease Cas2 [Alphaproteobacteria bacterium]
MLVLVIYDVSTVTREGRRRLRRVARACQDYGTRVQLSVFECTVDPAQWAVLRARLLDLIEPASDSLRFYLLGSGVRHIEHHGARAPLDPDGSLIF